MVAYRSLMSRYKDQPTNEVFAHFGYAGREGETWETPYERLASLAKPEDWDFHRSEFKRAGHRFPILIGYLNYTFLRVQEQSRIAFSKNSERACFNTGLQTPNEKDIYATFFQNKRGQLSYSNRRSSAITRLQSLTGIAAESSYCFR
jgi:hypothetical protein